MEINRHAPRQSVTVERNCSMGIVAFAHLDCTDHHASIRNISKTGVGVESKDQLKPGFVWFKDRIWGQHGGILLWSKQIGDQYRSGILFAPLPLDAERFVTNQVTSSRTREPLRDLNKINGALFESLKRIPALGAE
jgi:hypothetical protein